MEKIILFGYGRIGKRMLPYVRSIYGIKCWVDNDKSKWGQVHDGIEVLSPAMLKGYNGKIAVVVGYPIIDQIINQLLNSGIKEEQILRYWNIPNEMLLPYRCKNLPNTNMDLKEYDQYSLEDRESKNIKVIIFCVFFTSYVIQLIRNIKKRTRNIEFSIITQATEYKDILNNYATHIYVYSDFIELKSILVSLPRYNIAHLLWMEKEWLYFSDIIGDISDKLIVSVGGSDFYRNNDFMRRKLHKLVDISYKVSVESINVKRDYLEFFPDDKGKLCIVNYGLEVIDYIPLFQRNEKKELKNEFCIPHDRIIITCGHNAHKVHNHIEIIRALSKLDRIIKEKIYCVFPMTYPSGMQEYMDLIREEIEKAGLECRILVDYMDCYNMAKYACISDIMIHVQETDQLSSTMLEEMFAGTVIIAGSWLPYNWLRDEGIFFKSVDHIEEITDVLCEVINNFSEYIEKCSNNQNIIHRICSWDSVVDKWLELWGILDN